MDKRNGTDNDNNSLFKELITFVINFFVGIWLLLVANVSMVSYYIGLSEPKSLTTDVALITGAGSGLGRDLSLQLAELGVTIVAWDINENALKETATLVNQIYAKTNQNKSCLTYNVDVSKRDQVYESAKQVNDNLGPHKHVSILINNAGIYHCLHLHQLTDQQIERAFSINILAHYWTIRAFMPRMMQNRRGHIVEIASMAGISGLEKQSDYSATKFAVVGLEESLSLELAALNASDYIKTSVICPFFFSSNLFTDYQSFMHGLMSSDYVARKTVHAIQYEHNITMLPPYAKLIYILKPLLPRSTHIAWAKALGMFSCIKNIKTPAALKTT